jgi:hypothetical protein
MIIKANNEAAEIDLAIVEGISVGLGPGCCTSFPSFA